MGVTCQTREDLLCGRTNRHRREENAIYSTRRSYNRSAHKHHWEADVHNRILLFPSMDTGTMSWESAESFAHLHEPSDSKEHVFTSRWTSPSLQRAPGPHKIDAFVLMAWT